jgi:pSer/pThr/pTyr-binding forkhead associated (FHA) protein
MIVKLLVIHGRPAGKVLLFGPGDYFLGRGPECHVRFNSEWVSRQHCLLRVLQGRALLRDLASRNGTLVNGRLCEGERVLAEGDLIQLGPLVMKVRLEPGDSKDAVPLPEQPPTTLQPEDGGRAAGEPSMGSTAPYPSLKDPESGK